MELVRLEASVVAVVDFRFCSAFCEAMARCQSRHTRKSIETISITAPAVKGSQKPQRSNCATKSDRLNSAARTCSELMAHYMFPNVLLVNIWGNGIKMGGDLKCMLVK